MVSDSTIYTDIFSLARTILVAAAPYITNSTTGVTTAASIEATYNDMNASRPCIVIQPAQKEETARFFGTASGRKLINVQVNCYHSTTLGVDQLAQQVENAFTAYDYDATSQNIALIAFGSDVSFSNPNHAKFHQKSITFTFLKE